MRGKLNAFQVAMLRWRELHPYNAVHVVAVRQALQPERLKASIGRELESVGITGLVLDRRGGRFEYRGGAADVPLSILSGGDDALHVAEREIERQLNLPFPLDGAFLPFRFFAVDAGDFFHLGLVYDHFIAGGDSIAVLLGKLVDSYRLDAVVPWTPRLYPRTYTRLFLRHAGHAIRGLRRLPELAASARRSCRGPCHAEGEATNAFLSRRIAAADFAPLVHAARDWGVSRTDLFLALLLLALASLGADRGTAQRRRELGVAAIVNVRDEFEAGAAETFGQFLAALRVSHPVPPSIDLRELARAIHTETGRIKTEKLFLQTLLALGWAGLAWRFLSADRRRRFLAKHYPIWAGVTSLDVDTVWPAAARGETATEYMRAVPTGPLAPIVVAITIFGGVMQLGISFRQTDVSRDFAERLAVELVRQIRTLAR